MGTQHSRLLVQILGGDMLHEGIHVVELPFNSIGRDTKGGMRNGEKGLPGLYFKDLTSHFAGQTLDNLYQVDRTSGTCLTPFQRLERGSL